MHLLIKNSIHNNRCKAIKSSCRGYHELSVLPGVPQTQLVSGNAVQQGSYLPEGYNLSSQKRHAHQLDTVYYAALFKIIGETVEPLNDENRRNAFVIYDAIFERNGSKKVVLLAKVYNYPRHRFIHGFQMPTLGRSDGMTFLPINSCQLSTENQQNRLSDGKVLAPHSNGAKVRKLAVKKGTKVISDFISEAKSAGIHSDYVLFDSWFSSSRVIRSMRKKDLDVVAMVKKSRKIHYSFQKELLSCKDIYARCKKCRSRSRHLLSILFSSCNTGRLR